MAEKEEKKVAKRTASKTTATKTAAAKRPTTQGKRAVARPATRAVARPVEPAKARPQKPRAARAPAEEPMAPETPKAEPRPLPTAPAGQLPVIAMDGSVAGSVELPAPLADPKRRRGVLFQAVTVAASNRHLGTAATRNRARVAGGGAKPWRQKGTGRARQGSTRAPHWRHGGVVFGPNGRRYARRIPAKMRREAFAEAFAARASEGHVLAYEGIALEDGGRTNAMARWLAGLGDTGSVVLVTSAIDEATVRAAANVPAVRVRSVGTLRTEDLLAHDTLLVRRDALEALASRAATGTGGAR